MCLLWAAVTSSPIGSDAKNRPSSLSLGPLIHPPASFLGLLGADECFLKNILDYLHDSLANSLQSQVSFSSDTARSSKFELHGGLLNEILSYASAIYALVNNLPLF